VLTGAGEIALGRVVAATGCGLTVWGFAITVGVGLIVGEIGELADAMLAGGVERPIAGVSGAAAWSSGCWP
jgi:hypothetical protein